MSYGLRVACYGLRVYGQRAWRIGQGGRKPYNLSSELCHRPSELCLLTSVFRHLVTGCELRVTGYGLRVASYVFRVASYGLRVASYELRVYGQRARRIGQGGRKPYNLSSELCRRPSVLCPLTSVFRHLVTGCVLRATGN